MAIQDVKASFADNQDAEQTAVDKDSAATYGHSTNALDRSDGIDMGSREGTTEIAGDVANGNNLIVVLQTGLVDNHSASDGSTAAQIVGANKKCDIYLISGDELDSDGNIDTIGKTDVDGVEVTNEALITSIPATAKTTVRRGQIQFRVPPKTFFGRYLQLQYRCSKGVRVTGVTAWIQHGSGDAQHYYPDRSSIQA